MQSDAVMIVNAIRQLLHLNSKIVNEFNSNASVSDDGVNIVVIEMNALS